jgi:hypothetical protein
MGALLACVAAGYFVLQPHVAPPQPGSKTRFVQDGILKGVPIVVASITSDGAIELEGARYREVAALAAKIAQIEARKPEPLLQAERAKGTPSAMVVPAIRMLEKASGMAKAGFGAGPRE